MLEIPITDLQFQPDTQFDDKCEFFDKIIASKTGVIAGQSAPDKPYVPPPARNKIFDSIAGFIKMCVALGSND